MKKPHSPQKNPYKIMVEKDKVYFWCSCGLSSRQPFCDGGHKKEGNFRPQKIVFTESKDVFFCGCKLTKNSPFCDGSHSK